jgi:putative transposase
VPVSKGCPWLVALIRALSSCTTGFNVVGSSYRGTTTAGHCPWRDVDHVEVETLNWVDWFNSQRPHEYLDDLTPVAAEQLHYAHKHAPAVVG